MAPVPSPFKVQDRLPGQPLSLPNLIAFSTKGGAGVGIGTLPFGEMALELCSGVPPAAPKRC